jgi:hypothetical protein
MSDPRFSQPEKPAHRFNKQTSSGRIAARWMITILVSFFTFTNEIYAESALPDTVDPSGIGVSEEFLTAISFLETEKIDLNSAGMNELTEIPGISASEAAALIQWRKTNGDFESISAAADVPGLSPVASEAITRFAYVRKARNSGHAPEQRRTADTVDWGLKAKIGTSWSSTNSRCNASASTVWCVPDNMIMIDANWLESWRAGVALIAVPGISSVGASSETGDDATAGHLVAGKPSVIVDPAGFIATFERPTFRIVLGTYQVGFATGLTIDTTGLKNPDGHYPTLLYTLSAETGSIRKPKRFSGAAITFFVPVAADSYRISGSVFGSYSFMDPNRSEVTFDRCPSGQTDCTDSKKSPFITYADETINDSSLDYITLTNLTRECTAGADIGFGTDSWRVEAIGYATGLRFRPAISSLEPAVSSPFPENRRIFGAFGLAGSAVLPRNGLFKAEIAITDRVAPAAVVEARVSPVNGLDLETSFRYYSRNWDNPWTGSTADATEFRGNRARNETGGRVDLTWKSSRFTTNHFRLDIAYHGPDDVPDSSSPVDLEATASVDVFATKHERLSLEIGYGDRDILSSGRDLSYAPYYSSTKGNISGGCKVHWTMTALTTRIPRTRLTLFVSQSFEDVATLEDSFDMNMAATVRIDTRLAPGPDIAAFFRWSDESLTADNSPSPAQGCASGPVSGRLPGMCRGDTRLDAGLNLIQTFVTSAGDVRIYVSGRYTRHIDDRMSWQQVDDQARPPSRNEFAATCMVEFVRESRRRVTTGR